MWFLHQHCSCEYVCLCLCVGKKNAKSPTCFGRVSPGTALSLRQGEAERRPVLREERALLQAAFLKLFISAMYISSIKSLIYTNIVHNKLFFIIICWKYNAGSGYLSFSPTDPMPPSA